MLIEGSHIMSIFGKLYMANFIETVPIRDVTNTVINNGASNCAISLKNQKYGTYNYFGIKTDRGDIYTSNGFGGDLNNTAPTCAYTMIISGTRYPGTFYCDRQQIYVGNNYPNITIKKIICYCANSQALYKANNPYMGGIRTL